MVIKMTKSKLHTLSIETKFGPTFFFIQKQSDGTYNFQMDSCETILSNTDLKKLIEVIKKAILDK